jgi:adenosylhomocysteine nucleosidase
LIAILCATPREMSCLTSIVHGLQKQSPAGTHLVEGNLDGLDLVLLACGVGKAAAAAGSRFLIDHYDLDALVNYGIAGSLNGQVKTGDLVIATHLLSGDVGVAHSRGFKTTGPGACRGSGVVFSPRCPVSPAMLDRASAAAVRAGLNYHMGNLLTCDQVVLDPELRQHLGERFDALAVDMEGAAAAGVARGEGLPFVAARAISDELDYDFAGLEKILPIEGLARRHLWGRRFLLTVTTPSWVVRARELQRGMDLALANMRHFLQALLEDEALWPPGPAGLI